MIYHISVFLTTSSEFKWFPKTSWIVTLTQCERILFSQSRRCDNKHLMTGPEGNSSFCFPRISMFPRCAAEENKMNCFPRDQSLSDLLYSKKRKTCNGNNNGGRRSTSAGNSALLTSDVIDFALLLAQRLLAGNTFIIRCQVTSW